MEAAGYWLAAVVAAALVGMGKGGVPVVGMLGVPVMALVMSPVLAAGLLLPVYVLSDMFGLYAYRHAFNRRVFAIVASGATAGVVLGWATASIVPEPLVTLIVGLIGAVFAASLLVGRRREVAARPARLGPGLFWGTITGFALHDALTGGQILYFGTFSSAILIDAANRRVEIEHRDRLDQRVEPRHNAPVRSAREGRRRRLGRRTAGLVRAHHHRLAGFGGRTPGVGLARRPGPVRDDSGQHQAPQNGQCDGQAAHCRPIRRFRPGRPPIACRP